MGIFCKRFDLTTNAMTSAPSEDRSLSGRKFRSRKIRPCDLCRKRKARCLIQDGDKDCALCRSDRLECTFSAPPVKKKPKIQEESGLVLDASPPAVPLHSPPAPSSSSLGVSQYSNNNSNQALEALLLTANNTDFSPSTSIRPLPFLETPTLEGSVEHVGGTGQYFEELDRAAAQLPTSFVRVSDKQEATHRVEPAVERTLSPTETTLNDVIAAVGQQNADLLINIYFQVVHPVFPVCTMEDFTRSAMHLAAIQTDSNSYRLNESDDKSVAPLVACILVLAANYAWMHPKFSVNKVPDVECLRNYVRRACVIEARMPRLSTVQAFILQFTLLGFKTPAKSQELWSSMGLLLTTAENLGLHRDPTAWGIPKAEVATRKRLFWFILVTTTFLSLSLGKPNLVHPDFFDVPELTQDDFQEGIDGDILIRCCHLAQLVQRITTTFYAPKAAKALNQDPFLVKRMAPPFFEEVEKWYRDLNTHGTDLSKNSVSLHLVYTSVKISLHRTIMNHKQISEDSDRASALETMRSVAAWAQSLTAHQLTAVWPTHSKYDFTIVSSFMLALLFTSTTQEEFDKTHQILHSWRCTLQYHVRTYRELVEDALARVEAFYGNDGSDTLCEMWRQRRHLAIYNYSASNANTPNHPSRQTATLAVPEILPLSSLIDTTSASWLDTFGDPNLDPLNVTFDGLQSDAASITRSTEPLHTTQLDEFFWKNTGSSAFFPYDFWSTAQQAQSSDLQFGLMPDIEGFR